MIMAYWHNMQWEVSTSVVENLEGLNLCYEMESAQVKTKTDTVIVQKTNKKGITKNVKKKVKSQYVKAILAAQSISFSTTYRVATGTLDIWAKLEECKGLIGYSAPLIIGEDEINQNEWQLTQVKANNIELDAKGRIIKATFDFTLNETVDKKILKYSKKNLSNSALLVQARREDKAAKKTLSI